MAQRELKGMVDSTERLFDNVIKKVPRAVHGASEAVSRGVEKAKKYFSSSDEPSHKPSARRTTDIALKGKNRRRGADALAGLHAAKKQGN